MIEQIKRKIIGLTNQISRKEITPKDSNIGVLFNKLKTLDEPLYDELLQKYKTVLLNLKQT